MKISVPAIFASANIAFVLAKQLLFRNTELLNKKSHQIILKIQLQLHYCSSLNTCKEHDCKVLPTYSSSNRFI